jgi:hypothetical protein
MDASKITQLLQKQNTRYINRAQTVDSSTLTWKNQIQSSTYIKGVPTCRGVTNTNPVSQGCGPSTICATNGINAYGGQGKQTNLMTGSSQQYPNVLAGASGSASQVYSSDIIMLQKAGRNSCSVPGLSPAPPELPQNAYVILPTCYCANTNGPTNFLNLDGYPNVNNPTFPNPPNNPVVLDTPSVTINTYNLPINNQSNPYLPAFDTYYSMKNPNCNFPTPDQNQKHFVKQCHTRFPDANNGVNVLCTDCTTPPYLNNGSTITTPSFTPSGQYIQPTCDGCIIEPLVVIPAPPPPGIYRVTYDGNGADRGVPPIDPTLYAPGATVTVLNNVSLVKGSLTFSGWNTAADGSGTSYAVGSTFIINANTILYAVWV